MLATLAIGLCVLILWIIRRVAFGDKLRLREIPGRPNRLGILHVGLVVGWVAVNKFFEFTAERVEAPTLTVESLLASYFLLGFLFVLTLVVAQAAFRGGVVRGMGLTGRRWFVDTVRGVLAALAVYPVCQLVGWAGQMVLPESVKQTHQLLVFLGGDVSPFEMVLAVGVAFVAAPLVEETLYRGVLQSALRRLLGGPWPAILVASVVFVTAHLTILRGPFRVVGVEAVAPLLVLSVVLGYNYERTGRLWPSIVTHMVFNGINLMVTLLGAA